MLTFKLNLDSGAIEQTLKTVAQKASDIATVAGKQIADTTTAAVINGDTKSRYQLKALKFVSEKTALAVEEAFAGTILRTVARFSGIVGAIVLVKEGVEALIAAYNRGAEIDAVNQKLSAGFEKAGVSADDLSGELESVNTYSAEFADQTGIAALRVKELASEVAGVAGFTGETGKEITQLAAVVEQATGGLISGTEAITAFADGTRTAAGAEALGKLRKEMPDVALALELIEDPAERAKKAMEVLAPTLADLSSAPATTEAAFGKLSKTFGSLGDGISTIVFTTTEEIKTFFDDVATIFSGQFAKIINSITEVVQQVAPYIESAFQGVADVVLFVVNVFKQITNILSEIGVIVYDVLTTPFRFLFSVVQEIGSIIGGLTDTFKELTGGTEEIGSAWESVKEVFDTIVTALASVRDAVKSGYESFKQYFTPVGALLKEVIVVPVQAVVAIINSVVRGVVALAKSLYESFTNIATTVRTAVSSFLGLNNATTTAGNAFQTLRNIGNSVANVFSNLRANVGGVVEALRAIKTVVADAFTALTNFNLGKLSDILSGAGDKVKEAFQKGVQDTLEEQKKAVEATAESATEQATIFQKLQKEVAGFVNSAPKMEADQVTKRKATLEKLVEDNRVAGNLTRKQADDLAIELAKIQASEIKQTKDYSEELIKIQSETARIRADVRARQNADEKAKELLASQQRIKDAQDAVQTEIRKYLQAQDINDTQRATAIALLNDRLKAITVQGAQERAEIVGKYIQKDIEDLRKGEDERNNAVIASANARLESLNKINEMDEFSIERLQEIGALRVEIVKQNAEKETRAYVDSSVEYQKAREAILKRVAIGEISESDAVAQITASRKQIAQKLLTGDDAVSKAYQAILKRQGLTEKSERQKIDDEITKARLQTIVDRSEREKEAAMFAAQVVFNEEMRLAGANRNLQLQALVKFNAAKLAADQKYLLDTSTIYGTVKRVTDALTDALAKPIDNSRLTQLQSELDAFKTQEDDLRKSLQKREISYNEYVKRLNEIDAQRNAKQAEMGNATSAALTQVLQSLNVAFGEQVKQLTEQLKTLGDEYQSLMDDMNASDLDRDMAMEKLVEKSSELFFSQTAQMLTQGKSLLDSLALSALDTLQKLVPILVAQIFGQSFAQLGPIGGAIASAATIATFQGLIQVAKNSIGRYMGEVDIAGPGTTTSDDIPRLVSRGESIITARGTAENKELFTWINKTGQSADEYYFKKWKLDALAPLLAKNNIVVMNNNRELVEEMRGVKQSVQELQSNFASIYEDRRKVDVSLKVIEKPKHLQVY